MSHTVASEKGKWVLRVGEPGHYVPPGLPGAVPDHMQLPTDADEVDPRSPKKLRGGDKGLVDSGVQLDVHALKTLLSEQAASITEAQRYVISEAVQGLRRDMEIHRQEIRQELQAATVSIQKVDDRVESLEARVAKLESRPQGQGNLEERHRFTLIYGGWAKNSARAVILKELGRAMDKLELGHLLDTPAFTTGPRRSVALQGFVIRPGENYVAMRNRMSVVIAALANSTVLLGDGSTRLWASYSKSKEARQKGDFCAWVRRCVRALDPKQEPFFEPEYANGTSWLHGERVASATLPPPDCPEGDLFRAEGHEQRPWVNVKVVAELMKVPVDRVRSALLEAKR